MPGVACWLALTRLGASQQNPLIGSSAKLAYKHSVQIWRHKKSPPARSSGPLPQTKKNANAGVASWLALARRGASQQNSLNGSSAKSLYQHSVQIWQSKSTPPARYAGHYVCQPLTKKIVNAGRGQLACSSAAGCEPAKFIDWQLGKITISTLCPNMASQQVSSRALRWSLASEKKNANAGVASWLALARLGASQQNTLNGSSAKILYKHSV